MRASRLIQEVQDMVDSGQLSEFDAEWIQNLPQDQQLASAQKCMKVDPNFYPIRDMAPEFRQKRDRRGPYNGSTDGS